ncbi:hypothetical protein GIB67_007136, partial [Kingdonia uniflora]
IKEVTESNGSKALAKIISGEMKEVENVTQIKKAENSCESTICDENSKHRCLKQQSLFDQQKRDVQELRDTLRTTRAGKHLHGLAYATSGYQRVLEENRKLYNQVQDVKGSIRVYCRVQPFLPRQPNRSNSVEHIEEGSISIIVPLKYGKEGHRSFNFNKVVGPSATQEEVFVNTRPLILYVLEGFNVCIFAYGQTGYGKTHTMVRYSNNEIVLKISFIRYNCRYCIIQQGNVQILGGIYHVAFMHILLSVIWKNSVSERAENKSKDGNKKDEQLAPVVSSTSTSNLESVSSTPKVSEELKVASQLRKFTFIDLKSATRNFRPESLLGEGGFGCVFKGWIEENGTAAVKPGTGLTVAVKTLNHDGLQGHKEWMAEVNYLGDLLHPNLVKLIGYCIEDDQRLLVYDFMPRGSLENHLFRKGSLPLAWSIRMKIALGAARGLAFLHEEAEKPEYNAKLSDFGLAKDGPEGDKTHVSTRVMGTYGYAAPEYVMTATAVAELRNNPWPEVEFLTLGVLPSDAFDCWCYRDTTMFFINAVVLIYEYLKDIYPSFLLRLCRFIVLSLFM